MDWLLPIALLFIGLALGAGALWAGARAKDAAWAERLGDRERQLAEWRQTLDRQSAELERLRKEKDEQIAGLLEGNANLRTQAAEFKTALEQERKAAEEKLAVLDEAKVKLSDAFKALSSEALKSSNQSFLDLAKATLEKFQEAAKGDLEKRQQAIEELVKPVQQSLEKFDVNVRELERHRTGAYESLRQQVGSLLETQNQLRSETTNLVRALRQPAVRGRWGEIQLRRVVEMAGMLDHCDFYEQMSGGTKESPLRPDLIVKLPAGKNIVVDAKAPLSAYLEAIEAADDTSRRAKMIDHARQVRDHVAKLGRKAYWDQFQPAPEFVVLFLPGENFFSAALEQDPSLIEVGIEQGVLLATPTSLIALLRAVHYGWRQEALAQNAQAISDLGRELYERISTYAGHLAKLGHDLDSAIGSYNKAVASLESRVLVSARRFKDLRAAPDGKEIVELSPIEQAPRELQLPEPQEPRADRLEALESPLGEDATDGAS